MTIAGLCIPVGGVVAQGGINVAKNVAITVAKETFTGQAMDFTISHAVEAMTQGLDQRYLKT